MSTEMILCDLNRKRSILDFDLQRCYDVYRLENLIHRHIKDLNRLRAELVQGIKELEDLDNEPQ